MNEYIQACFTVFLLVGIYYSFLEARSRSLTNERFDMLYRNIALGISLLTVVLVVFGLLVTFSEGKESIELVALLFRASIPLATLAGFYMIYLNFLTQKRRNERDSYNRQVELRLNYHLQNVSNFRMTDSQSDSRQIFVGQSAMEFFIRTFDQHYYRLENIWLFFCMGALNKNPNFDSNEPKYQALNQRIVESSNLPEDIINQIWIICENNRQFVHQTLFRRVGHHINLRHFYIEMVYNFLFFNRNSVDRWLKEVLNMPVIMEINENDNFARVPGVAETDFPSIQSAMSGSTFNSVIFPSQPTEGPFQTSSKTIDVDPEAETTFPENQGIEFSNVQVFLSHYFRNLYALYRYIHSITESEFQSSLSSLVKTQLSTYEQGIIFLNSLTSYGREWVSEENNFFEKFKVIENMPGGLFTSVNPADYYPELEWQTEIPFSD